jgi:hypothetical protein
MTVMMTPATLPLAPSGARVFPWQRPERPLGDRSSVPLGVGKHTTTLSHSKRY